MVDPDTSGDIAGEAQAQDEETIMPWLWGGCGLVLIAAFVAWVVLAAPHDHRIREPAGAAPIMHSVSQHD
jgi:hypothetical protein